MDYGGLLKRALNIVKENPYLILLGIVISLTNGGGGSSSNYSMSDDQMEQIFGSGQVMEQLEAWMGFAVAAIVGLLCVLLIVFIVLWFVGQIARGGLIAGVESIEDSHGFSLGDSWRAGWHKKWTLVGIGLVLLIPVLLLILLGVGGLFVFFGAAFGVGDWLSPAAMFGNAMFGFIGVLCIFVPVALFIGLWSEFAYRACMLEGTGVFASYGRGWHVLIDNIGPVIVIVLIRIGIGIALFLPTLMVSLCCLLWPVLILLQGAVSTYFSTVWTLAWRDFTGEPSLPAEETLEPAV